ncbi:MAG TPA: AMP-binding protein, partial [Acidimicrobiia bacterium]|nr:AMP-binding protein [Acidimicrobiia bacterium]
MAQGDWITDARTMWQLLEQRAEREGERVMFVDEQERTVSFAGFRDRALRVAAGLRELGIDAGTPVSWQLPSRIDTIVLSMALSRIGAVQSPIIHLYRDREVGFALRQT